MGRQPEDRQERGRKAIDPLSEMKVQEVVEPRPEADGAVDGFMYPAPILQGEEWCFLGPRQIQTPSPLYGGENPERGAPPPGDRTQSSIPRVGEDGTAISRLGIRPAR